MNNLLNLLLAAPLAFGPMGHAFFENHMIQHEPETIMVVVGPDGAVEEVRILAFQEPADYLPSPNWLAGFRGRTLEQISLVREGLASGIGSAMAGQALTEGVRRLVAVFQVVAGDL